jgi:hypothetical protein
LSQRDREMFWSELTSRLSLMARPIPSVLAFCLKEPSDLFISFAIFGTGVLAFECCFSNLMSDTVYGLRAGFFLFALANLFLLEADGAQNTWYYSSSAQSVVRGPGVAQLSPHRGHRFSN